MSMSRCTKFALNNGKEELSIYWDSTNGEFEIKKEKILQERSEENNRQSICIRTTDLSPKEWIELANTIYESFGKLFENYGCLDDFDLEFPDPLTCSLEEFPTIMEDEDEDEDEDEFC